MTNTESLLESYPGTHVAFQSDLPVWSLCRVDLEKRKAWVVNGGYQIEWDDTDLYFRHDHKDKLNWLFEIGPEFCIVRTEDIWPDQRNELKPDSPGGVERTDFSV